MPGSATCRTCANDHQIQRVRVALSFIVSAAHGSGEVPMFLQLSNGKGKKFTVSGKSYEQIYA